MGKVRKVALGDEKFEKEQKRKAEARREGKKAKKAKVEGVGLHGGERTSVVEGTELKAEVKELLEKVEKGETAGKESKKKKSSGPKVRGKKYQEAVKLIEKSKLYPTTDAVKLVKKTSVTKFDATVELHINLNPATLGEKTDYRGSVTLPHGTGKQVRVLVADDEIIAEITAGKINFDILIAHPSMMPKLAKVARILGPKGLMPNPKTGTITTDVEKRVKELSHGQVNFKTEPDNPLIHMAIGKVSFEDAQLKENIEAVITAIGRGKLAKVTISSTMGPGIKVEV
jgi:large subunit ribosomal protein L1